MLNDSFRTRTIKDKTINILEYFIRYSIVRYFIFENSPTLRQFTLIHIILRKRAISRRHILDIIAAIVEWRLTDNLEWKSSSCHGHFELPGRRVIADFRRALTTRYMTWVSTVIYAAIPPRWISIPFARKLRKQWLDGSSAYRRAADYWPNPRWFSVTRRDVPNANTVIQRWSMSTGIFTAYAANRLGWWTNERIEYHDRYRVYKYFHKFWSDSIAKWQIIVIARYDIIEVTANILFYLIYNCILKKIH